MSDALIKTLPAPATIVVPGIGQVTISKVLLTLFQLKAIIEKSGNVLESLNAEFNGYNDSTDTSTPAPILKLNIPDVDLLRAVYAAVDTAFTTVDNVVDSYLVVNALENAIASAVASLPAKQKSVTIAMAALSAQQARLATYQGQPNTDAGKAAAVTEATAAVATATTALASATTAVTVAQQLIWDTLLSQWQTASASLSPTGLPMALRTRTVADDGSITYVSAVRPDGI